MQQRMGRALRRALLDDFGISADALEQLQFLRLLEFLQRCDAVRNVVGQSAFPQLAQNTGNARVRVLNVVHRIFVGAGLGQFHVEIQVLVIAAHHVEQPRGIVAHLVAQVPQGDIVARALRHLGFLAAAKQGHDLHQQHFKTAGWQP